LKKKENFCTAASPKSEEKEDQLCRFKKKKKEGKSVEGKVGTRRKKEGQPFSYNRNGRWLTKKETKRGIKGVQKKQPE